MGEWVNRKGMGVEMETFAGKVRAAMQSLKGMDGGMGAGDIAGAAGLQTYDDKERVRSVLRDFCRGGEAERVAKGRYRYIGKGVERQTLQQKMWRYFRMARTVSVDDLREVVGASAEYAGEWLRGMVRMGIARDCGNGKYQLLKDPVEMPRDNAKAEYLRRHRQARKDALAALGRVRLALDEAIEAVALMAVDGEDKEVSDGGE